MKSTKYFIDVKTNNASIPWIALIHIAIIVLLTSFILYLSWTGYVASDSALYVQSGIGWLTNFPYVADHFGTARVTIGIPIAISMSTFGNSEFASVAPTCFYWIATLIVTYLALSGRLGNNFSLVTVASMATVPLFALKATIPSADLPAVFFCSLSFWLFIHSFDADRRRATLIGSGAAVGLAFIGHEAAAALVVFYSTLFLLGLAMPRRDYWIVAAGFAAVIGLEMFYYGAMTGDPLYRFRLTFGAARIADRTIVEPFQFDDSGNFHIFKAIDPLVMVLSKQEFCLTYYFAIPALFWAIFLIRPNRLGTGLTLTDENIAWLSALAGLIWFLFVAIAMHQLKLLPRYYMMPTYFFLIVIAFWIKLYILQRWPKATTILIAIFILVNFIGIAADNKNPLFGERELVNYLGLSEEPIFSDPYTVDRARDLCNWAKADCSRMIGMPPKDNALYFYYPKNATRPNHLMKSSEASNYIPKADWQVIWQQPQPPQALGHILGALGVVEILPKPIAEKLLSQKTAITLYYTSRLKNE